MFKKVVFLFLVPLSASVAFYACTCDEEGDYLLPYSFSAQLYDGDNYDAPAYYNDTLFLNTYLSLQCIVAKSGYEIPFVNTAMATSKRCPCGESGFKAAITGLSVYTDSAYANFSAGADITSLFSGRRFERLSENTYNTTYYSVADIPAKLIEYSRVYNGGGNADIQLFLTQKPGGFTTNSFTIKLTTQDTVFTVHTIPFEWI